MTPMVIPLTSRSTARKRLAASWLFVVFAFATGSAQEPQTPATKSADDVKAEEAFTRNCVKCHPVDRIVGSRRTRPQWEEVMTTMQTARGAVIADEEWEVILGYLVKQHGRVNVNRATIDDLVEVLGITTESADAIVKYRREHGNFEDFDGFAKVPGLDPGKLEKKRDAISF
jgi:competence ComEA-like helix-hairpin-helix protein